MQAPRLVAILAAILGLGLASAVSANPSVGAGATSSTDDTASDKTSREKSQSTDKSNTSKTSTSKSTDKSRETSRDKSSTNKQSQDKKASKDVQRKINVNSLLIQGFIDSFEVEQGPGILGDFLYRCKPFSKLDAAFPVASRRMGRIPGATQILLGGVTPLNIVTKEFEGHIVGGITLNYFEGRKLGVTGAELKTGVVNSYIECRVVAHHVVRIAAELLTKLPALPDEDTAESAIRTIYTQQIASYWDDEIRPRVKRSMGRILLCAPFVAYMSDGHDIDCGTFKVRGDQIVVDGIPTLSTEAINGQKYEIALSAGTSTTAGTEQATKLSSNTKASSKTSTSHETGNETKNNVGMKKSKSSDDGSTTKSSRDASSKTDATPRD